MSLDQYWADMVTVALLGTDRREPPASTSSGISGLVDLAADHGATTASERLLQQVAACTVVRRAGVVPGEPVDRIAAPAADPRPVVSPAATATWRRVVDEYPVLEDEWMLGVLRTGQRLSPDTVPSVLTRHRGDPVRHARARAAAGPLADWLVGWQPALRCTRRGSVSAEAIAELPALPTLADLPAEVDALVHDLVTGRLGPAHQKVLEHHVARIDPALLVPLADALDGVDPSAASALSYPVVRSLCELARLRHHLLTELEPT